MINTKYLLYISTCLLISGNVQASNFKLTYDSSDIFSHGSALHTQLHTPNELKPIPLFNTDNAVKLAAVCAVGGGGCAGLTFGEGNNSMSLDEDSLCTDDGYVRSCPPGQIKDTNNLCPHNKSYFKCRTADDSCEDGYTLSTTCGAEQTSENSYTNEAGNICTLCRDKTCAEGGYSDSMTSCQNGTAVFFANKTCYQDVSPKDCESEGLLSTVPENYTCTPFSFCDMTCQTDCRPLECEDKDGYMSACPENHDCETKTDFAGKTCYKDNGQPSCSDGGYKTDIPTNNVCTQVNYFGNKCFDNCYLPTCDNGGYLGAQPTGQTCTPITYYGRTCYQNDCKNVTAGLPILYSDMTVDDKIIKGKTPIGIVLDTNKRLAVALDQSSSRLEWGGYLTDIPSLKNCSSEPFSCGTDGKANTAAIIAFGKANNISYPAAEYCNKYTTPGTKAGDWHLPSYAEQRSIYKARNMVDATLKLLGKPLLSEMDGPYWSSTEYDSIFTWEYLNDDYYNAYATKKLTFYVWPMITYEAIDETIECDEWESSFSIVYTDGSICANIVPSKTPYAIIISDDDVNSTNIQDRAFALVIYNSALKGYSQFTSLGLHNCTKDEDGNCKLGTYETFTPYIQSISPGCYNNLCECRTRNGMVLNDGEINTKNAKKAHATGFYEWILTYTSAHHREIFGQTKGYTLDQIDDVKGLLYVPGYYEADTTFSYRNELNDIITELNKYYGEYTYPLIEKEPIWMSTQGMDGSQCYYSNGNIYGANPETQYNTYLFVHYRDFVEKALNANYTEQNLQ